MHLKAPVRVKCFPTIVNSCPVTPLLPREGMTLSTVAPAPYMNSISLAVKSAPSFVLTSTSTPPPFMDTGAKHVMRLEVIIRTSAPITVSVPNLHCSPVALDTPPLTTTDTAAPRPSVPTLGRTLTMRTCSRCSKDKIPVKKAPEGPSDTRNSTAPRVDVFGDTHSTDACPRTTPSTTSAPKWHDNVPTSPCIRPYMETVTVVCPCAGALLGVTDAIPRPASKVSCWLESPPSTPLLLTLTRTVPAPLNGTMHLTIDVDTYTALTMLFTPILQLDSGASLK